MQKTKKLLAFVLAMVVMFAGLPMYGMDVKAAPAKLNAKDFVYTVNGKKEDFSKGGLLVRVIYDFTSKKDMKASVKNFKTNRGIKLGHKASNVKKKYGNTPKVKVSKKEKFYKQIKYNFGYYGMVDQSLWKSYLEYTYKKGSDKYKIRFYLDKKDKVSAVVYLKNLEQSYNCPNKQVKSGLTFHAPKGKKITTKTINGKKVYLLPKGTKISFNKGSISKSKFEDLYVGIYRYNEYGAYTEGTYVRYSIGRKMRWKQGKKYSLSDIMKKVSWDGCISGGYHTADILCCQMMFWQYTKAGGVFFSEDTKVAPEGFYFILEGDSWYYK